MVWVRLDDSFCEHPKVKLLSPAAFRLHVEALCYCGRTLSEGFVPKPFVEGREAPAAELSRTPTGYEHGLWEEKADGWVIHDFLEYNPSRAQVKHGRKVTSKRVKRWRNAKRNAVTNADVTAPRTRPVPVPVPSGSEAEASSPERTRSSAGADTGARVVQRIWNENRGNLPKCEAVNGARERRMRLLHAEAGADEALLASTAAAFAADPFNRERGYGIDTLTRAEHRSKWLDRGRNGTPTNGKRELPDWAKALPGGDPE